MLEPVSQEVGGDHQEWKVKEHLPECYQGKKCFVATWNPMNSVHLVSFIAVHAVFIKRGPVLIFPFVSGYN